ncbi:hypothetical protein PFJ02_13295 [Mycobacterium xenopi]|uniref:hypothetical protein n=1 Tax=Mycobacterium xenopi TaxID=1789 RepID=UPI0022EA9467|nr:hypothetical protein [Mycobacterium xenopi]MDA3663012.1 hypothetical protein [Mycobacterium xenopi]
MRVTAHPDGKKKERVLSIRRLSAIGQRFERSRVGEAVLSLNPWMGDFVLPSTRLFWDAAECGAVGRG